MMFPKILTLAIFVSFSAIINQSISSEADLATNYKEKLHQSIYEKFEAVMYNRLRHEGLNHEETINKINEAANTGIKCQFEAFNKLPKPLVNQIFSLVNEGKSIMEANHIAMTNFKIGYLSSGKTDDDFLKFIEPSAIAWDTCMKANLKW